MKIGSAIDDVSASQGRDLVTILPYDTPSVPVEMEFPFVQLGIDVAKATFLIITDKDGLLKSLENKFKALRSQLSVRLDVEVDSVSMAEVIPIGSEASSVG